MIEESAINFASCNSLLPYNLPNDESFVEECFMGERSPLTPNAFKDENYEPKKFFPSSLNVIDSRDQNYGKLIELVQGKSLDRRRIGDLIKSTLLYDGTPKPEDVVASSVETFSGFLTLLAFLSTKPELIKKLLKGKDYYEEGKATTRLFIDGKWTSLTLDDRVPIFVEADDKSPNPATLKSAGSRSLRLINVKSTLCCYALRNKSWVSILQKAYSKAFGSYIYIAGPIDPEKYLRDLTGAPVYRRFLESEAYVQDCAEVARYVSQGYMVLVDSKDSPKNAQVSQFTR